MSPFPLTGLLLSIVVGLLLCADLCGATLALGGWAPLATVSSSAPGFFLPNTPQLFPTTAVFAGKVHVVSRIGSQIIYSYSTDGVSFTTSTLTTTFRASFNPTLVVATATDGVTQFLVLLWVSQFTPGTQLWYSVYDPNANPPFAAPQADTFVSNAGGTIAAVYQPPSGSRAGQNVVVYASNVPYYTGSDTYQEGYSTVFTIDASSGVVTFPSTGPVLVGDALEGPAIWQANSAIALNYLFATDSLQLIAAYQGQGEVYVSSDPTQANSWYTVDYLPGSTITSSTANYGFTSTPLSIGASCTDLLALFYISSNDVTPPNVLGYTLIAEASSPIYGQPQTVPSTLGHVSTQPVPVNFNGVLFIYFNNLAGSLSYTYTTTSS